LHQFSGDDSKILSKANLGSKKEDIIVSPVYMIFTNYLEQKIALINA
jgi:hypothetical protein